MCAKLLNQARSFFFFRNALTICTFESRSTALPTKSPETCQKFGLISFFCEYHSSRNNFGSSYACDSYIDLRNFEQRVYRTSLIQSFLDFITQILAASAQLVCILMFIWKLLKQRFSATRQTRSYVCQQMCRSVMLQISWRVKQDTLISKIFRLQVTFCLRSSAVRQAFFRHPRIWIDV